MYNYTCIFLIQNLSTQRKHALECDFIGSVAKCTWLVSDVGSVWRFYYVLMCASRKRLGWPLSGLSLIKLMHGCIWPLAARVEVNLRRKQPVTILNLGMTM